MNKNNFCYDNVVIYFYQQKKNMLNIFFIIIIIFLIVYFKMYVKKLYKFVFERKSLLCYIWLVVVF